MAVKKMGLAPSKRRKRVRRKGVHAKGKRSGNPNSKNYVKKYNRQGRP
jgi:hypothetical protein